MVKKILCRADGNSAIGLGHLYRMFAIVEFCKENYEIIFLTKESTTTSIFPKEYTVELVPSNISIDDEPKWISKNYASSKYIIVIDGYQFKSNYQKLLKQFNYKLIYIDDLKTEYMYADVIVNHSVQANSSDYSSKKYTQFALGTSFAMLRPSFINAAKEIRKIDKIENVFICFGGADPYNLSLKAANALIKIESIKQVHIVLGGAYIHEEIFLLEKESKKIKLYKNLDEGVLCKVMKLCQFAIAPSSTILYELCSVKIPVLSGYYVKNQIDFYKGLLKKEIIIGGGDFSNYKSDDFEKATRKFINQRNYNSYIERQQQLFNGKNKSLFLGLANKLNLSCRLASTDDLEMIFKWSNDNLVRKNSFNSDKIKLEEHTNWYLNKIKDKNALFLVMLVNEKPAGIVRFEIQNNQSIIGIIVSSDFRGQKLSESFLKLASKEYFKNFKQPILAYIKKENQPSIKAFLNSGYRFLKEEIIKENTSLVYKLEKE